MPTLLYKWNHITNEPWSLAFLLSAVVLWEFIQLREFTNCLFTDVAEQCTWSPPVDDIWAVFSLGLLLIELL
jgi:hypothetical protein